jgi:translation initiation factor IF-2
VVPVVKSACPEARILAGFIVRLRGEEKIRVLAANMKADKRQQVAEALREVGKERLANLVRDLKECSNGSDLARLLIRTGGTRDTLDAIKWSLDNKTLDILKFSLGNIGRRDIVHYLEYGYFPADKI